GEAGGPAADGAQVTVSIRGAAGHRARPGDRAEEPGSHHRGVAAGARRTAMVPIFSSQPACPDSRGSSADGGDATNRDRQCALVSAFLVPLRFSPEGSGSGELSFTIHDLNNWRRCIRVTILRLDR